MTGKEPSRQKKSPSILRKLMIPLILVMALQASLFAGSIYLFGTMDQLNQNAVDILNERVISRQSYLQNEMLQRWSNVEESVQYVQGVVSEVLAEKGLTAAELAAGDEASAAILDRTA